MKINSKEMQKISKIKNYFYDDFKIYFLYNSNILEGSTFSKENLEKLLFDKKVTGEHFFDDVAETRNSLNVFDRVINDCDKPLDKFILFDWQRKLKKGTVDEEIYNTGCWKQYKNKLHNVDLKLAYPNEVDNSMFNLLIDWEKITNPNIEDIARFHYRFEKIHPFQNDNGRIGRFIILKQCLESNVDLVVINNKYEKEYKSSLYKSQMTDDVTDLVNVFKLCQDCLDSKMKNYDNFLRQIKSEVEKQQ